MRTEHQEQINKVIEGLQGKSITHIYFTACGGSQAVLMAGQYIIDKETSIPAHVYTANEFVYDTPKEVNDHALVITCSHSGNTPETVNAAKKAREKGAIVVALSNEISSPLCQAAEYPIHYDWGKEADASDLNKAILYGLVFKLLSTLDGSEKWEICLKALSKLNELTIKTKKENAEFAKQWGKDSKRDNIIYTIGSGINYGEVYSTAACWFMEMQWLHSNSIHSGEFFHGPFEIVDFDVPFILIKSIGSTRYLDERVEKFTTKFSDRFVVLDQADFDLTSVEEEAREYIAAILSGVVIRQMVESIAFERGHSLDVRRYMWQMEY